MKQKLIRSIIIILCCTFSANASTLCNELWDPILESTSLAGLIFFSLTSKECKDGGSSFDCMKGGFAPTLGLALGLGAVNALRYYAGGCYHLDSLKEQKEKNDYDTIWKPGSVCEEKFELVGFPDNDFKGKRIKNAIASNFENEWNKTNGKGCFVISFDEHYEMENERVKLMKICAIRKSDNFHRCCTFNDDILLHGNSSIEKAARYLTRSIIYGKNVPDLGGRISISDK